MTPGSAVPAWLQQILPTWFVARPAFTEALFAFVVSITHASYLILTMIAADAAADGVRTWGDFHPWWATHWFILALGYLAGGGVATDRARRAHAKAVAASA